jgi:hypothetical protein
MRRVLALVSILGGLLAIPGAAQAQEITGTITGLVIDSTGAIVPGAAVKVRNMETNLTLRPITDATGIYVAPLLPPGRYEVSVEHPGFKTVVKQDFELHVNDRLRVDIILEAGNVAETVTVVGVSPVVQTQTSEVSTLINATQVEKMPLNGRNIVQFVAMQPGVSSGLGSTLFVGLGSLVSVYVNGNRASQNNWMVDGTDNNDVGSNLALINYVNVDAVGEIKILRSNYSAEFGRSGGGQVNVVTKAGTNNLRGSVFEFVRNDAFDSINYFSTIDYNGDGKRDAAPLRYNNFGGTIGFPIVKDKLFLFWGEEFRRIRQVRGGGVQNTRVPTVGQRAGDFSEFPVVIKDPLTGLQFPGNVIPDNRIDPLARQLLDRFPLPNANPNVLGGNLNFSTGTPQVRNFREELVRVDYRLGLNHSIYGRFINDTIPSEEPFGEIFGSNNAAFPGIANTKTDNPGRSFVGTWNWIIGSTKVNELAFNYSRGAILSQITGNAQRDVAIPKVFSGTPGDDILPGISFGAGGYGGFNFFGPYDNTYRSYRIKETLNWVTGPHALRMGLLGSWEFKNENAASGTNGAFNFPGTSSSAFTSTGDALADFMLGRSNSYSENNVDIASHLRFQMYEGFVQDDWRVKSNLTLNLGVRWSAILQPYDTEDILDNFDPSVFDPNKAYKIGSDNNRVLDGTGDPLNGLIIAGQNSPYGRRVTKSYWNDFGPRIGFSWDPFSDGKTAVRGGYGKYFDRTLVGIALQNAFVNPPFVYAAVFSAAGGNGPTLGNPQAGAQRNNEAIVVSLNAMSTDFKIPTTHQYSVGVQRELFYGFNLDVAYVGSQGRNLLRAYDINQTPAGTLSPTNAARPYRGYGNITLRATDATSSYNSLQMSVLRRWAQGVQINVNYTLSKAVSDSSSDRSDLAQNIKNLAAERAVTSYDRTHIFGVHYAIELPFYRNTDKTWLYNIAGGWEIDGSTRYATGVPLTIIQSANSMNSYGNIQRRPDLVGDPSGPQTVAQWFNTAAFAQPAANTFGSSPRSVVRGPHANVTDLALVKKFRTGTRFQLQFRIEAFNVFDTTQFTGVGTNLGTPAQFGRLLTAGDPRLIQLGMKINF